MGNSMNTNSKMAKKELIEKFFFNTGKSYDQVVSIFTLGIDRLWKKRMIEKMVLHFGEAAPKKILDLACGTGILTTAIAERFPESEVVGVDISPDYLEVAWRKAHKKKIKNTSFILASAEEFSSSSPFDCVMASYLAKYADIPLLIKNLSGMINPGGVLLFHDFTYPKDRFYQMLFEGYFKVAPVLGGLLYPEWKAILRELPNVIRETKWVSELTEALNREKFSGITVESLTLEGSALVSAKKLSSTVRSAM
jgi:demethylmenaquinone methyltransferase/2-methoxy-6-polyprenyl-1,4-benzoquinol methylase